MISMAISCSAVQYVITRRERDATYSWFPRFPILHISELLVMMYATVIVGPNAVSRSARTMDAEGMPVG
jgi:hypothetical protein